MDDDKLYWIWLSEALGQGGVHAALLIRRYGGAKGVFEDAGESLEADEELTPEALAVIRKKLKKPSLIRAGEILERCESRGIAVLTPNCPAYPEPLRTLRDLPLVLYCIGVLPDFRNRMLTAVVGTRKMSDYGRRIAYELGAGLAFGGAVVVSGMALGADSMALIGALDAGGDVIAVLGSGVDVVYPTDHKEIYQKILTRGAVVSEYPPGTPPVGSHFPVRNRIMSGLSDAAVVVEAGRQSGALITAKRALEQGRKLFAVPGQVGDPGAEGTNDLIRDGAIPAIQAEDILSEFEFIYKTVSVDRAHLKMRNLDFNDLSLTAMQRTRIGTRGTQTPQTSASPGFRRSEFRSSAKQIADEKYFRSFEERRAMEEKMTQGKSEGGPVLPADRPADGKRSPIPAKKPDAPAGKENDYRGTLKQTVNSDENFIPAKKTELDLLDETEMKVYNKMKPNTPLLPDELVDASLPIGTVMSALTVLELAGAVESGGGGYFMRVTPDDIMQSEND